MIDDTGNTEVRLCDIKHGSGSCGFNLAKTKWDPYPWVSSVEEESPAAAAGVQPGDCLLEVNGEDIIGLRISQVAAKVRSRGDRVTVMLWNAGVDSDCNSETMCCGPMPSNLQRLVACMKCIVEALECPICLETTQPPAHQCVNGHIICLECRTKTDRCPVCRVRLFRGRNLIADQVFNSLIEAFDLSREDERKRAKLLREKIHGPSQVKEQRPMTPEIKINFLSPTNKFLSRLMGLGKSSSVENLSAKDSCDTSGLKAKSLSSSEINKASCGLALTRRPGSGLLDVADGRPTSYHGSAEELRARLATDFDIEIPLTRAVNVLCPLSPMCKDVVCVENLKTHIRAHNIPLIHFYRSQVQLTPSLFIDSLIVLECFNALFFVRSVLSERIWIWTVLDGDNVQYTASITWNGVVLHCDVMPLNEQAMSTSHCGIPIDKFDLTDDSVVTISINEARQ